MNIVRSSIGLGSFTHVSGKEVPGPQSPRGPQRSTAPSTGGGTLRPVHQGKPPISPTGIHTPIVDIPRPTPTPPGVTSVDRSRLDGPNQMDNPFWTGPRRVPAGTRGNAGRPHTTGNMGPDNVRWKGPGHYWRGFPCNAPNNCGYDPGMYRRPSGQGHGPDTPDLQYGGTIKGPGMFEASGQGVSDRQQDLDRIGNDAAADISRTLFPPQNRNNIPTGVLGATSSRKKKQ